MIRWQFSNFVSVISRRAKPSKGNLLHLEDNTGKLPAFASDRKYGVLCFVRSTENCFYGHSFSVLLLSSAVESEKWSVGVCKGGTV